MWVTGCTHLSYAIYQMYKYVIFVTFKMPIKKSLVISLNVKGNKVVFCDNSDDEEGLTLDDDDLGFLKKILKSIGRNGKMNDVVKANKEPSQSGISRAGDDTRQQLEENSMPSDSSEQLKFKWKKTFTRKPKKSL